MAGVVVLSVSSPLDLASVASWEAAIENGAGKSRHLIVDLTGCTFLDTAGVAMLFRLHQRFADKQHVMLFVTRPGSPPDHVLRLVRADSQIPVLRSLRTALALADNRAREVDGGSGPLRAGRDSHGATGARSGLVGKRDAWSRATPTEVDPRSGRVSSL
jgi:anti-sigma B factor antagonist